MNLRFQLGLSHSLQSWNWRFIHVCTVSRSSTFHSSMVPPWNNWAEHAGLIGVRMATKNLADLAFFHQVEEGAESAGNVGLSQRWKGGIKRGSHFYLQPKVQVYDSYHMSVVLWEEDWCTSVLLPPKQCKTWKWDGRGIRSTNVMTGITIQLPCHWRSIGPLLSCFSSFASPFECHCRLIVPIIKFW